MRPLLSMSLNDYNMPFNDIIVYNIDFIYYNMKRIEKRHIKSITYNMQHITLLYKHNYITTALQCNETRNYYKGMRMRGRFIREPFGVRVQGTFPQNTGDVLPTFVTKTGLLIRQPINDLTTKLSEEELFPVAYTTFTAP